MNSTSRTRPDNVSRRRLPLARGRRTARCRARSPATGTPCSNALHLSPEVSTAPLPTATYRPSSSNVSTSGRAAVRASRGCRTAFVPRAASMVEGSSSSFVQLLNLGAAVLRWAPVRPETGPSWFSAPLRARFVVAGLWIPCGSTRYPRVYDGSDGSQRYAGAVGLPSKRNL